MLIDGVCKTPEAINCKEYQDLKTCATCQNLFHKEKSLDGDKVNCVAKNIPNCKIIDDNTAQCSECNSGYYLHSEINKSPQCLSAIPIQNCVKYVG